MSKKLSKVDEINLINNELVDKFREMINQPVNDETKEVMRTIGVEIMSEWINNRILQDVITLGNKNKN